MLGRAVPLLIMLAGAAPVAAQIRALPNDGSAGRWKIPMEVVPPIARPGLAMPVIEYTAPDGSLKLKRGIVAGIEVGQNAKVGIGLFETLPKKHSLLPSDNPLERKPKRSRKAAVGLSFNF